MEWLAVLTLRAHGVVLTLETDVQLVRAGTLGMIVALAGRGATLTNIGKVAPSKTNFVFEKCRKYCMTIVRGNNYAG